MPTRRRNNYHAVCYVVTSNDYSVAVSNQFVAKIIYQLWIQRNLDKNINAVVTVTALMSPNSWSTWSKKHIIGLLNGTWKQRLLCKAQIKNGECQHILNNAAMKITGDHYESNAIQTYRKTNDRIMTSLTNTLTYPNILQLVLRAPTALAAKVAMKTEGYLKWEDGSKVDYIDKVWEYLHFETRRL